MSGLGVRDCHGSVSGLGTPGSLTVVSGVGQVVVSGLGTPGTLTVVSGVGHSKKSHGSFWGWALQGLSR